MTSKRRRTQAEMYAQIHPTIVEYANVYYGDVVENGFRHFAFETVLGFGRDIQGNDIVSCTAIDGSDDFEIDGFYLPDSVDESAVHLFQSKHRKPGTRMGVEQLAKFLEAPHRILSKSQAALSHNEEVKSLHDSLLQRLKGEPSGFGINLVWVTSGRLTAKARKHAEERRSSAISVEVDGETVSVPITFEVWDLPDLHHQFEVQSSSESAPDCDHIFNIEEGSYHEAIGGAGFRTLFATMPVGEIVEVYQKYNFDIFRENPRGPLGNKINREMKLTLLNKNDRHYFHLLNNGITAICRKWRIANGQLTVENFQIINGCQTAVTIGDVRAEIRDDPDVRVTIKLTECEPDFGRRIAYTTNRQATLRAEDFISNESVQIRLKEEFGRIPPSWFYEIKRGEWQKMTDQKQKENFRDQSGGFRRLNSKEVAQAVLAYSGFPGEAKDKIRNFLNKESVSSIAKESEFSYDGIYNGGVSAMQLMLPVLIQRRVWRQVVQDKSTADWLDYARFHVVWLVGEILRDHYGQTDRLFPPSKAFAVASEIENWFAPIYRVAVAAIRSSIEPIRNSDQYPGHREFFRTAANYRTMESNLRNAIELASDVTGSHPTANLPA